MSHPLICYADLRFTKYNPSPNNPIAAAPVPAASPVIGKCSTASVISGLFVSSATCSA
ncbi:hypothetical protein [Macrococcoides bohemicum]|uniref:hypothetical protein n=1 Tax=Macrococcoides bohemicum TaxID=1903056 RepID=UPI00289B34A9|nr:hypothetical protein [Macrococcus bohemicus]